MYEQLQPTNCHQLSLWSEATHASHSATPENAEDMPTNATCGLKCSDLCESSRLLGLLEKTLKATLPSDSMKSLMTWRERVTPRGRSYFQLVPSVRRIRESGFLLWPTPVAQPANGTPEMFLERKRKAIAKGSKMGLCLTDLQLVVVAKERGMKGRGKLNPRWLGWLMGYPDNWTECKCSETQ
jgi:hypothetical protein